MASGQDLKDELAHGVELTITVWRCIQRMLSAKEMKMSGLASKMERVFDPHFMKELCKPDNEVDWDYIEMMKTLN